MLLNYSKIRLLYQTLLLVYAERFYLKDIAMLNNQQLVTNSKNNILKYSLILLLAVSISLIAYRSTPLNRILKQVIRSALTLQGQWMGYSHSIVSWFASTLFVLMIMLGLIAPFILGIIIVLNLCKKEWLPDGDPNFTKPLNYWLNSVLIAFFLMLVVRSLETLGYFYSS